MPLSLHLPQYIDPIVVSEGPRHLVVVHGEVVLLDAPQLGQTRGVHYLEDPGVLVLPLDVSGVPLVGVVQQLLQEVPQQAAVGGGGLGVRLLRRGGRGGARRLGRGRGEGRPFHAVLAVRVRGMGGVGGGGQVHGRHAHLLLGGVPGGAVEGGIGRQGHGVCLGDEVGEVGEGLGGRGGEEGPVGGEGGGGGHEARGPGGQRRAGENGVGLPQQHLKDVVDDVTGA